MLPPRLAAPLSSHQVPIPLWRPFLLSCFCFVAHWFNQGPSYRHGSLVNLRTWTTHRCLVSPKTMASSLPATVDCQYHPWVRWDPMTHLLLIVNRLSLVQVTTASGKSWASWPCQSPKTAFHNLVPSSAFYILSTIPLQCSLSLWRDHIVAPFKPEYSTVTVFRASWPVTNLWINPYLLQWEASLIEAEGSSSLWIDTQILMGQFDNVSVI